MATLEAYVGARNLVTLSYEELHDQRIIQRPNMLQRARWLGALQPRAMEFSSQPSLNHATHADTRNRRRAFIALGSNIGDRFKNIERACNLMNEMGHIKVLRTSGLWETTPMYVVDQELFLNGVCEIETTCDPFELLDMLEGMQSSLGRVKVIDKGPRSIDLDILLFGDEVVKQTRLTVPHHSMLEREFVLRPLCELIPNETLPAPYQLISVREHLHNLPPSASPISTMTPLAPGVPPLASLLPNRKTQVMSILNITPDSFSDGGLHFPTTNTSSQVSEPFGLERTVREQIAQGARIVDVGGQSTRPNARSITAAEEISRVVPVIKMIRSLPEAAGITVSIDTYRASVAVAAFDAGAHLINDVSGGLLDDDMLSTAANLGCTIILMHMRGTPETMTQMTDYSTYAGGVVEGVATELLARVRAAEGAGIRRWRIVLDPGIGFSKTEEQNLELLRRLGDLRDWDGLRGLPWMVGSSRKAFIGRITGVKEAKERTWGTAATVTSAVAGGADIVRVHDVQQMAQVVKMADAIYRR